MNGAPWELWGILAIGVGLCIYFGWQAVKADAKRSAITSALDRFLASPDYSSFHDERVLRILDLLAADRIEEAEAQLTLLPGFARE